MATWEEEALSAREAKDSGWATFAQLALFWATAEGIGRKGRRRMFRRLQAIADACERGAKVRELGQAGPSTEAEAEMLAAARFIGPAVTLLRRQFPDD